MGAKYPAPVFCVALHAGSGEDARNKSRATGVPCILPAAFFVLLRLRLGDSVCSRPMPCLLQRSRSFAALLFRLSASGSRTRQLAVPRLRRWDQCRPSSPAGTGSSPLSHQLMSGASCRGHAITADGPGSFSAATDSLAGTTSRCPRATASPLAREESRSGRHDCQPLPDHSFTVREAQANERRLDGSKTRDGSTAMDQ